MTKKLFVYRTLFLVCAVFGFGSFLECHLKQLPLGNLDNPDELRMSVKWIEKGSVFPILFSQRAVKKKITEILSERLQEPFKKDAQQIANRLVFLCGRYHLDPTFVLALIEVESAFRPGVVSAAGAVGLMQLQLPTAQFILRELIGEQEGSLARFRTDLPRDVRSEEELLDHPQQLRKSLQRPLFNMDLGISYLAWLRKRYAGYHPYYVLAAYNMGPAKLDQLLERKSFQPDKTAKYYQSIIKLLQAYRNYEKGKVLPPQWT